MADEDELDLDLWRVDELLWCPGAIIVDALWALGCEIPDEDGALLKLTRGDQTRAVWVPGAELEHYADLRLVAPADLATRPGLDYWPAKLTPGQE